MAEVNVNPSELYFLIFDFLKQQSGKDAATSELLSSLVQRYEDKGCFGESVNWNGAVINKTFSSVKNSNADLDSDHLRQLLQSLAASKQTQEERRPQYFKYSSLLSTDLLSQPNVASPFSDLPHQDRLLVEKLHKHRNLVTELAHLQKRMAEREEAESKSTGKEIITNDDDVRELVQLTEQKRIKDIPILLRDLEKEIHQLRQCVKKNHKLKASLKSDNLLYQIRKQPTIGNPHSTFQRHPRIITNHYRKMKILKKITGHKASCFCIDIDTRGKLAITGSDDTLCKIWNCVSGELYTTLRGHASVICDATIDPTNNYIATASEDCTVRLWELNTGRALSVFSHQKLVSMVAFSNSGESLISASDDGSCCVWDVKKLVENDLYAAANPAAPLNQTANVPIALPHVNQNQKPIQVNCLDVHPYMDLVVTGNEDGTGRIWWTGKTLPPANLHSVSASTIPNLLGDTMQYIDGSRHIVSVLRGHVGRIVFVQWSRNGERVLTGSDKDQTVRIYYWVRKNYIQTVINTSTVWHPDFWTLPQQQVLRMSNNSVAQRGRGGNKRAALPMVDAGIWNADDTLIATAQHVKPKNDDVHGFWDQQVRVWRSDNASLVHILRCHRNQTYFLKAHPNQPQIIMSSGTDGLFCIWDIHAGVLLNVMEPRSPLGNGIIYDAKFVRPTMSCPCDIIASDSLGRIIMIGVGEGHEYDAAPPEQFFANDYAELIRDTNQHVLDSGSNLPPHLVARQPICDVHYTPYSVQFPPREANDGVYLPLPMDCQLFTRKEYEENRLQRIKMVEPITEKLNKEEEISMIPFKEPLKQQDDEIERARKADKEYFEGLNAEAPTVSSRISKSIPRTPKTPRTPAALPSNVSKLNGLLRVEVEELMDHDDSSADESESEDLDDNVTNGRGRKAARKANGLIKRYQKFEEVYYRDLSPSRSRRRPRRQPKVVADNDEYDDLVSVLSSGEESDAIFEDELPRRRGERIKKRIDYAAIDDYDENMDYESSSSDENKKKSIVTKKTLPAAARKNSKKKKVKIKKKKTKREQQNKALLQLLERQSYSWIRSWLQMSNAPGPGEMNIVQRGDVVVYSVQGHYDYLMHHPISDSPPWTKLEWKTPDWPVVLCFAEKITYAFPTDLQHSSTHSITSTVTLNIIATPIEETSSSNAIWRKLQMTRRAAKTQFDVTYSKDNFSDFLIPLERYEAGVRQRIELNDAVQVVYGNQNGESEFYEGTVDHIAPKDNNTWPTSPWEAFEIGWTDQADNSLHSPWDIKNISKGTLAPWDAPLSSLPEYNLFYLSDETAESIFDELNQVIDEQEYVEPFIYPVDLNELSEYGLIVPLPMCLNVVMKRLKSRYYRHLPSVEDDLNLIVSNCLLYNQQDSAIAQSALKLQDAFDYIITKYANSDRRLTRTVSEKSNNGSSSTTVRRAITTRVESTATDKASSSRASAIREEHPIVENQPKPSAKPKPKTKSPVKAKSPAKAVKRKSRKVVDSSDDDEDDDDDDFELDEGDDDDDDEEELEEDFAPARTSRSGRRSSNRNPLPAAAATRSSRRATKKVKYTSDESYSDDDEEDEDYGGRSFRKRPIRQATSTKTVKRSRRNK